MKKPVIVIGGATASGKTALSIALAKEIDGEIISADSMQIYRFMDIGTAKVTKAEQENIPHYLIDECNPDEAYHVMKFQQRAKLYMEEIWNRGKIPIVVGGTGFYINALVFDTDFTETEADDVFRQAYYERAEKEGAEVLHQELLEIDPIYANTVHANNVKKVVRALEYYHQTGELFSTHNAKQKQKQKESPYDAKVIILTMERKQLYERIEKRIDLMMEQGLLLEVEQLLLKGYKKELISMQGIGYKEIISYLDGECTLKEAVDTLKQNTRHFAKRQNTWFRGQIDGLTIDISDLDIQRALRQSLEYCNI